MPRRPWSGNVGRRFVRTPKTYRRDSGLVHVLLDLAFEREGRVEMAIGIRRSTAPGLSRDFADATAILKPKETWLVHGGSESWPIVRRFGSPPLRCHERFRSNAPNG
jgi:hypothetical protein